MHFASVFSLVALAAGANAAAIQRADPHIADFRTFGAPGCSAENQGVWTFTQSDLTGCKAFDTTSPDLVKALTLTDIKEGCSLTLYTDDKCQSGAQNAPVAGCNSNDSAFKSFVIKC